MSAAWCRVLLALGAALGASADSGGGRCEEIRIAMCRGIGYNMTAMPNELNHDSQEEAGLEVHQFYPLVEIRCAADLRFFLCSVYMPICIESYSKPLPACRAVCERARAGCEPIMQQYGFQWPDRMACDRLPAYGDQQRLCMDEGNRSDSAPAPKPSRRPPQECRPGKKGCKGSHGPGHMNEKGQQDCSCRCRPPLVTLSHDSPWINSSISVGGVADCGFPCRGVFFTQKEKEFAAIWITLWSGLCFVSTLMTVTTFLIDTERFRYPERPIVFLSACYLLVSAGYLVRAALGHDAVACDGALIRYSAKGPVVCTLVFLLVYFFGMASSIWWVVLSFTWFLAAGLKWGNEAIAGYSQYFHLAAWLVPTIKAVAVLVMAAVDGDPVAGICYVGNQNPDNLRGFVLAPLLVYLLVGTSFLLGGFVSLFRIRNVIKQQGGVGGRSKADKLEKLMIRIGIFSVLYTVPATIVIACHLYESSLHAAWMAPLVCPCSTRLRPLYSVLMLKHFMALAVGITSGVWIWSGKTLDSWRRLWRRLFGGSAGPGPVTGPGKTLLAAPHVAVHPPQPQHVLKPQHV